MLYYALVFFLISIAAGLLGFKNIESGASKIAKILFFVFLAVAIVIVVLAVLGLSIAF
jgi:uncharacterized membrane protein YtjA (UPF0391 family)